MAREIKKLTARKVATLKNPGRHSDGGGLYPAISTDGATRRRRRSSSSAGRAGYEK